MDQMGLPVIGFDLSWSVSSGSMEDLKVINDEKKDVFAEAKGEGFDIKILKEVIRLRKQDQDERDEHEALLDVYLRAVETVVAPRAQAAE